MIFKEALSLFYIIILHIFLAFNRYFTRKMTNFRDEFY